MLKIDDMTKTRVDYGVRGEFSDFNRMVDAYEIEDDNGRHVSIQHSALLPEWGIYVHGACAGGHGQLNGFRTAQDALDAYNDIFYK